MTEGLSEKGAPSSRGVIGRVGGMDCSERLGLGVVGLPAPGRRFLFLFIAPIRFDRIIRTTKTTASQSMICLDAMILQVIGGFSLGPVSFVRPAMELRISVSATTFFIR